MESPIDKLSKFLRLEAERGFDDRAVFGGLRSILESWENEARAAELPNLIIQAVTARLRDYHQLTPASREEILRGLWKRVTRSMQGNVPKLFEDSAVSTVKRRPEPRQPAERLKPTRKEPARETTSEPDEKDGAQADEASERVEKPAAAAEGGRRKSAGIRKYTIPPALAEDEAAALNAPLTVLSGIGPKISERLAILDVHTLGDALFFFPRRYDDYSRLEPINRLMYGQTVTVIGSVEQVRLRPTRTGRTVIEALISDGSGALRVTWFNQPWLVGQLKEAGNVSLSGRIDQHLGRLVMNSPEWEPLEKRNLHTHRIVPVYPLTGKISQKWLRGKIREVVDYWADRVQEELPAQILKDAELMPISFALKQIHSPDSQEDLTAARHRLAFDEIFSLQLGVQFQRRIWTERQGTKFETPDEWLQQQYSRLPYPLTAAQKSSIQDIRSDLASGHPMNRLLQGDVGSGKTVVAAMGIGMVTRTGAQTALMAPTGILAEQHYLGLVPLLSLEGSVLKPEEVALLLGSTPAGEKEGIRAGLKAGRIKLVIGTHALLEPDVEFLNLELIVIDEQHRFGVRQRATLREKGANPHLLVMTATPIPRSLALTVFGDLDLSVINEMPPGRQEISTHLLRPVERERAYTLVQREVERGRQAFMIFPLVEESEKSEAKAAVEEYERLQKEVFHNQKVGLLHGRMNGQEKETVMASFRDGDIQILVSTSVVEVGVDVPNATVMVIESAERFGLAQLHQFRGRVGRGREKSFCLLISGQDDAAENERLKAMSETNDGFILAERDLEQRGPGEFLGTRQSGYSTLKLASITDLQLVEKARRFAQELFARDPALSDPAHSGLARRVQEIWGRVKGDVS